MTRIKGFTLVEVLVVISIIALLLSLLMPTVEGSREVARRQLCASNFRQFGMAYQAYYTENRGLCARRIYDGYLQPYIDEAKWHRNACPSWGQLEKNNATGWYGRSIGLSTSIAGGWTWGNRPLKIEHVRKPSVTYIFADCSTVHMNNWAVIETNTVVRGRHKAEGLNFYFFDGHVEFLRSNNTAELGSPSETPNAEWRSYPQSCVSMGSATGPNTCTRRGCFFHPY
jgi:prepilin-type N-terminal cleavage/methylation domain-containing protein/prepilin-type processing-associated H-X9-DG protein